LDRLRSPHLSIHIAFYLQDLVYGYPNIREISLLNYNTVYLPAII